MIRVENNDRGHGDIERLLRRFKKACADAGIIGEVRQREEFEKPSAVRRRKRKKKLETIRMLNGKANKIKDRCDSERSSVIEY